MEIPCETVPPDLDYGDIPEEGFNEMVEELFLMYDREEEAAERKRLTEAAVRCESKPAE